MFSSPSSVPSEWLAESGCRAALVASLLLGLRIRPVIRAMARRCCLESLVAMIRWSFRSRR